MPLRTYSDSFSLGLRPHGPLAVPIQICFALLSGSAVTLLLALRFQFALRLLQACRRLRMTLAGLEPAIFGSEDQRLIH